MLTRTGLAASQSPTNLLAEYLDAFEESPQSFCITLSRHGNGSRRWLASQVYLQPFLPKYTRYTCVNFIACDPVPTIENAIFIFRHVQFHSGLHLKMST